MLHFVIILLCIIHTTTNAMEENQKPQKSLFKLSDDNKTEKDEKKKSPSAEKLEKLKSSKEKNTADKPRRSLGLPSLPNLFKFKTSDEAPTSPNQISTIARSRSPSPTPPADRKKQMNTDIPAILINPTGKPVNQEITQQESHSSTKIKQTIDIPSININPTTKPLTEEGTQPVLPFIKQSYPHEVPGYYKNPFSKNTIQENKQMGFLSLQINNLLIKAVQENNPNDLTAILNPDINTEDENKNTLLNLAVKNKNKDMVKELLKQNKILVNKPNRWGNTPLHNAVLFYLPSIIKMLLNDPRIDTTKKNTEKTLAHQLFPFEGEDLSALKGLFFARFTLDNVVKEEAFDIGMSLKTSKATIDELAKGVQAIAQERIKNDQTIQVTNKSIPIPEHAINYTSPEFIKAVILDRLSKESAPEVQINFTETAHLEFVKDIDIRVNTPENTPKDTSKDTRSDTK